MRQPWGVLAIAVLAPSLAVAGGKITIGENQSVSVGGGIRASLNFIEDGSPDGDSFSKDFGLDSARIYLGGQVSKGIFTELNTELSGNNLDILDAVVKFEYTEGFRVWIGRFLPPSDRANLDGPYYMPVWDYPTFSLTGCNCYPAIFAGRDNGVAAWGQFKGGKFKYQAGAFRGFENGSDNPLLAGRLVLNLRDPEPGYYNSSTYWGGKKIFAIGVSGQAQSEGAGAGKDFSGINIDVLFEQPLDAGVFTAEGAFYSFDYGSNTVAAQGSAFYAWAAYLIKNKAGVGQFQPIVRYSKWDSDAAASDYDRLDVGLNYVIEGDNARLHFVYAKNGGDVADGSEIKLGVQVQF
jgi:hypothetical protein